MRGRDILRTVISDTDILCAVESHMPQIRGLQAAVNPVLKTIAVWPSDHVIKLDKKLESGCKDAKQFLRDAIQRACMSRLKAERIDAYSLSDEMDPATVMLASWGLHVYEQVLDDFSKSYEMVYRVLAGRIDSKKMHAVQLDKLHMGFSEFMSASSAFTVKLNALDKELDHLTKGQPVFDRAVCALMEAAEGFKLTRKAFNDLKEAHHAGYQVSKAR